MSTKFRLLTGLFIGVFALSLSSCNAQQGRNHGNTNLHTNTKSNHHKTKKEKQNAMKIEAPNRITHTYEQTINGSIQEIIPLYCPVRELEWCENWNPSAVYSNSGVVEKDCIFVTPHGDTDIVWIVTDFNLEQGHVEMFYHIPNVLVTKLEIQVLPMSKKKSKAVITYSKTSLSKIGDKALEEFTETSYNTMMDSWEKAMNHYLKTGELLTGLPNF